MWEGVLCDNEVSSPVHIFLNVTGDIKIDHMLHMWDVQTPGRYRRGHQEGSAARLETVQRSFPI